MQARTLSTRPHHRLSGSFERQMQLSVCSVLIIAMGAVRGAGRAVPEGEIEEGHPPTRLSGAPTGAPEGARAARVRVRSPDARRSRDGASDAPGIEAVWRRLRSSAGSVNESPARSASRAGTSRKCS